MKLLISFLTLHTIVNAQVIFPDEVNIGTRSQAISSVSNPSTLGIIPEQCGVPGQPERRGPQNSRVRRVSGGIASKEGRWPWLVAIGVSNNGRFGTKCGGSLITKRHVITAASCLRSYSKTNEEYLIRVGVYNMSNPETGSPRHYAIASHINPGYIHDTVENDISLITLAGSVTFGTYIQPACLPFNEKNNDFTRKMMAVVGWGRIEQGSDIVSDVPLETGVQIVSMDSCISSYSKLSKNSLDERNLCAGTGGRDACGGDSGGPLNYLGNDGRYYVVGIVSYGAGCGHPDFPGVYTRVTTFLDWILKNIK